MNIEDRLKQFDQELLFKVGDKRYRDGIHYAQGLLNKYFNSRECVYYHLESIDRCKNCKYICEMYQTKKEFTEL